MRSRALLPLGLLVLLLSVPARSQYLYLDTNGNGIHDADDRLAPTGTTEVDIWLDTDHDRDGTLRTCDVADSMNGLTMNSYTVVLHVAGGDVKWGAMRNRLPFHDPDFDPVCFAIASDTTGADWYHNGWGSYGQFPPGRYLLATLPVTATSGSPSLFIEPYLPSRPTAITQFGTSCMAADGDNTYKLGLDWHDADGLGPLRADSGGPYKTSAGRALAVDASGTRFPATGAIAFHWDFGDGGAGDGEWATHVYATAGTYRIILTATSPTMTDADTTSVEVVPEHAPVAQFLAPETGTVGIPVVADARASYDPDNDRLAYYWDFGDGSGSIPSLAVTMHTYTGGGTFTIQLRVSDGLLEDRASRQIVIPVTVPVYHPPVADAGGPYAGIMGRLVEFDASKSSDPDGNTLGFFWEFGDRTNGAGAFVSHRYEAPGVYSVRLTVRNATYSEAVLTTATIIEQLPARVFIVGSDTYAKGQSEPLTMHVEPENGSFRLQDVNPFPIELHSTGSGSVDQIFSAGDARAVGDSDGNGVPELEFDFAPEGLTTLLGDAEPGTRVLATVRGTLFDGGYFSARVSIGIGAPQAVWRPLRIAPNPFNPEATVTFSTRRAGPVSAHLFDVHGRLVRTVLDHVPLGVGPHALALETRNEGGVVLASGIYFFRLTEPDGVTTRRVAIAK